MAFETADELISMLSHHWYKEPDGNLYKMLNIYSNDMEQINDSDQKVIEWRAIQNAEGSTLDLFGKDIKTARPTQDDEPYRFLIYLKTLLARAQGTIPSIFKITSTALGTTKGIKIWKTKNPRHVGIMLPWDYVNDDYIQRFLVNNLQHMLALGYWLDVIVFDAATHVHGYLGVGTTDHTDYKEKNNSIWWTGWNARTFNHWYFGTGLHVDEKYNQKMTAKWWSGWTAKQDMKRYFAVATADHKESSNTLSTKWWTGWQSRAPAQQYVASASSSLHEQNCKTTAVWWTGWDDKSSLPFILGLQSVSTDKQIQTAL